MLIKVLKCSNLQLCLGTIYRFWTFQLIVVMDLITHVLFSLKLKSHITRHRNWSRVSEGKACLQGKIIPGSLNDLTHHCTFVSKLISSKSLGEHLGKKWFSDPISRSLTGLWCLSESVFIRSCHWWFWQSTNFEKNSFKLLKYLA
jgi:hypothetical protein